MVKIFRKPSKVWKSCKGSSYITLKVLSHKRNLIHTRESNNQSESVLVNCRWSHCCFPAITDLEWKPWQDDNTFTTCSQGCDKPAAIVDKLWDFYLSCWRHCHSHLDQTSEPTNVGLPRFFDTRGDFWPHKCQSELYHCWSLVVSWWLVSTWLHTEDSGRIIKKTASTTRMNKNKEVED